MKRPRPAISLQARATSSWSTRDKLYRLAWYLIQATLFRYSLQPMYRWRNFLLRLFGARIHPSARIRPTVMVEIPWHLTVGAHAIIGDYVILYSLGSIAIGDRAMISQYSHLCAGTHDYTQFELPLVCPSIVIEEDVWIAADVFVGPGVCVQTGTVVGARSSVFHPLPPWKVCVGYPARPIKDRQLNPPEEAPNFPKPATHHSAPVGE
jgi:putative colanic acid biosynthesis acetyltransferase WcaF